MSPEAPPPEKGWSGRRGKLQEYNVRTILKTGSYLNSFCPYCGKSLMRDHWIHLEMLTREGREGWIDLSPYLNVFEHSSDTHLPAGQEVGDLRCWHCHRSLQVEGRHCGFGDARVAAILVGVSSVKVPFYFCMREGCRWHEIDPNDEHRIILDDSNEW